jgi:hypothetical protein
MLRKLIYFSLFCVVAYSCYYDWSIGTLPAAMTATASDEVIIIDATEEESIPSMEVTVMNGETVLSIVERINDGYLPSSMQKIVDDFEALNPSITAHIIKSGKTYSFPLYIKE